MSQHILEFERQKDWQEIGQLQGKVERAVKDLTFLASKTKDEVVKGYLYGVIEDLKRQ